MTTGPVTSYLRNGDKSMTTAFSRQAQYSAMAPEFDIWLANQKPLYSLKSRV